MNKFMGLGTLTKDPVVSYSGEMAIARYTLAVNRRIKKEGQPDADFISCVAFGKAAEFAEKWLKKGTKIAVVGHVQTGSYKNKDGNTVYTVDFVIDEQEFAGSKQNSNSESKPIVNNTPSGFESINMEIEEEELPFL